MTPHASPDDSGPFFDRLPSFELGGEAEHAHQA
jgi:hypothetical protein